MYKLLSVCLSLILATVLVTQVSAADNSRTKKNHSKKNPQPTQEIVPPGSSQRSKVQEIGGKKIASEARTGPAVALRASQLRKKNKGFARAYNALIKRGGKPIFEKAGVTVLAVDTSQAAMNKVALNSPQDIVDGDYEMSFFPVDNGNPATWEGLIYVKSPSGDGTYAIAHDTSNENLEVYYEEYYAGDGGGGQDYQQVRLPKKEDLGRALAFSSSTLSASEAGSAVNAFPRMRDFLTCIAMGLYVVLDGCRFAGPFFWHCVVGGAIVAIGFCLAATW